MSLNWIDTETQAILFKSPDAKLAPPTVAEFALVLLKKGSDPQRLARAIQRINGCPASDAAEMADWHPVPLIVHAGLSEANAIHGQFELICCDAISVFLRSEIVLNADETNYLENVYRTALKSPEFAETKVEILNIPNTEDGDSFIDQFLGAPEPGERVGVKRFKTWVPFKKARIMKHWASRIGAGIKCDGI